MAHRVHIFGASGSGTTTLGAHLAASMGARHIDADSYYWYPTDPAFTRKREPAERVSLIERDIAGIDDWVLSGSLCSWGDALLGRFTLAVFLHLDPAVRMARIAERERERYGTRILPDGDMYRQHLEFMAWAASYDTAEAPIRSLDLHERWMATLRCPILRLDSANSVSDLCRETLRRMRG
jgi:adenylate kinase family enzyme